MPSPRQIEKPPQPPTAAETRSRIALSVSDAAQRSPALAGLAAQVAEARAQLRALEDLIPPDLRDAVEAGPISPADWCLLVRGNAAAAKLRQLRPHLEERLKARGFQVSNIRIKVRMQR
ncbi:MAG: hypothetical protein ABIW85_08335 [Variovorax sp.]